MIVVDQYYIINLKRNNIRKQSCLHQLQYFDITNYTFIDAIDATDKTYDFMYEMITSKMNPLFVKCNFTRGALGCLLSHLQCIKHAQDHAYQHIIVLEDDFLFSKQYLIHLRALLEHISSNLVTWDFIYLGKKQGTQNMSMQVVESIHKDNNYFDIIDIDSLLYRPNYKTWGTHAFLVKHTMFAELLHYETNIVGPIDLMLMTSYPSFTFACLKRDIVIASDNHSDILTKTSIDWGWNVNQFLNNTIATPTNTIAANRVATATNTPIKNIIVIGFKYDNHTHHNIHKMYVNFFTYYYPMVSVYWIDSEIDIDRLGKKIVAKETIFFLSPCQKQMTFVPAMQNGYFIVHLDEFDNAGYKSISDFRQCPLLGESIQQNKFIILTCRENIRGMRYFDRDIAAKIICLPWFANVLQPDIPLHLHNTNKKYLGFIGSIWNLNIDMICSLIEVCERLKVFLLLKGRLFSLTDEQTQFIQSLNKTHSYITYVPFKYVYSATAVENTFEYLDQTFGIKGLLPLQGAEHHGNYISNRVFETISLGFPAVTNNKLIQEWFPSVLYYEDIEELIVHYNNLLNDPEQMAKVYNTQKDEFLSKFYGYHNLQHITSFLKECYACDNIKLNAKGMKL